MGVGDMLRWPGNGKQLYFFQFLDKMVLVRLITLYSYHIFMEDKLVEI